MCYTQYFNTKKEALQGITPKIADKDIIVYKGLQKTQKKGVYRSPWKFLEWRRGDHFYQKSNNEFDRVFGITGVKRSRDRNKWYFDIYEGLHSAATKEEAENNSNHLYSSIIFQMIIPKGSKYYFNGKVYVSDNLIFPYLEK